MVGPSRELIRQASIREAANFHAMLAVEPGATPQKARLVALRKAVAFRFAQRQQPDHAPSAMRPGIAEP